MKFPVILIMMREQQAKECFSEDLTDRERAAFEIGIKLGTLFHIAMGTPVSRKEDVLLALENALEKSISCQPYVSSVDVKLNASRIMGEKKDEFDYSTINPQSLKAIIALDYKDIHVEGHVGWNDELKYPLMYISKMVERET